VLGYGVLFIAIEVLGTLAKRAFGNFGFMAATGISGVASSASAKAAAAILSASGKVSPELAGTAVVIASIASALTNLPLIFRHLSRPLLLRIVGFTALQMAVGIGILAVQHHYLSHSMPH